MEELSPGGPLLQQAADIPALYSAWRKVRANRGAAGIDSISVAAFERKLEPNLAELSRNLLDGTYEPMPARRTAIPKPSGGCRELAIPTVRDRVAQRSVLDLVEPIFEPMFLDCSYAFRPGRSIEMAVQRLIVSRGRGYNWTVDADVRDFFPSMDHSILMAELGAALSDPSILRLVKMWVEAGALETPPDAPRWPERLRSLTADAGLKISDSITHAAGQLAGSRLAASGIDYDAEHFPFGEQPAASKSISKLLIGKLVEDGLLLAVANRALLAGTAGAAILGLGGAALAALALTPALLARLARPGEPCGAMQGSPISPLLSNVYLHPFDVEMSGQGARMIRYADDFVVACRGENEAKAALTAARKALAARGLRLKEAKTRIVSPHKEFVFLGFCFLPDGGVTAPPGLPEPVIRRVTAFAGLWKKAYRACASMGSYGRSGLAGSLRRVGARVLGRGYGPE